MTHQVARADVAWANGFDFHAAIDSFVSNKPTCAGPCVAATTRPSALGQVLHEVFLDGVGRQVAEAFLVDLPRHDRGYAALGGCLAD